MNELGNVSLHLRLVALARDSRRQMETLVDTVMVEREKLVDEVHNRSLWIGSFGNLVNVGNVGMEDSDEEKKIEALIDKVKEDARNTG